MPVYEILNALGEVENRINATSELVESLYPGRWRLVEVAAPAPLAQPRRITVAAFLKRFGTHMLPIMTSQEPVVQALIQLVQAHKFIDLDDASLTSFLPVLVSYGLISAEEVQEIINAEVQETERP